MSELICLVEIVGAVNKLPRYACNYEVGVGVGAKLNRKLQKTGKNKLPVSF